MWPIESRGILLLTASKKESRTTNVAGCWHGFGVPAESVFDASHSFDDVGDHESGKV